MIALDDGINPSSDSYLFVSRVFRRLFRRSLSSLTSAEKPLQCFFPLLAPIQPCLRADPAGRGNSVYKTRLPHRLGSVHKRAVPYSARPEPRDGVDGSSVPVWMPATQNV